MVKNTQGGSHHKKQASKAIQESRQPTKLRKAEEDGEVYAMVTKMVGGALCNVIGVDNIARSCVIRGKFRGGGGKRNNFIKVGTLVLVGDREWMSNTPLAAGGAAGAVVSVKKKDIICDLLEVYSDLEKDQLKTQCTTVNWSALNTADTNGGKMDDSVLFTETAGQEDDFYASLSSLKRSAGVTPTTSTSSKGVGFDGEEIDIDAI